MDEAEYTQVRSLIVSGCYKTAQVATVKYLLARIVKEGSNSFQQLVDGNHLPKIITMDIVLSRFIICNVILDRRC